MSILNDRNAQLMALPTAPQAIPLLTRLAQQPDPTNPMQQTIALMKLNEIKRMQSGMQAMQAPQGTVKDQTVQQMAQNMGGVANLQNSRMQSGMQQMAAQLGNAQAAAPQGTGQPVQAAKGGLMSLPVKRYNGEDASLVDTDKPKTSGQAMWRDLMDWQKRKTQENIESLKSSPPAELLKAIASIKGGPEITYRNPEGTPSIYASEEDWAKYRGKQAAQAGDVQPTDSRGIPAGTGARLRYVAKSAPDKQLAPPTDSAGKGQLRTSERTGIATALPQQAATPTEGEWAKINKELYNQAPVQADRSKVAEKREALRRQYDAQIEASKARAAEEAAGFKTTEGQRSSESVWKALMAAGEATRGKRGLGSLASALGGYGQSVIGAREGERSRAAEQAKALEVRANLQQQLAQKVQELEVAYATGDADRVDALQKDIRNTKEKIGSVMAQVEGTLQRGRESDAAAMQRQMLENQSRLQAARIGAESRIGGAGGEDKQRLNELKALQTSLKDQLKESYLPSERVKLQQQLAQVNAVISKMSGVELGGSPTGANPADPLGLRK